MPATLSKPNGLSERQHCVRRVVHSQAFCEISGPSDYACQSFRKPAAMGCRRGVCIYHLVNGQVIDFLFASRISKRNKEKQNNVES